MYGVQHEFREVKQVLQDSIRQAQHYLDEGRADRAIPLLQEAAAQAPQQASLWKLLGMAYHDEQLEPEAVGALERAVALEPQDLGAAMMLAQSSFFAGLPALAHFQRLQQLAPGDLNVVRGYALALAGENQRDAAETLLHNALQTQPDWLAGHKTLTSLRHTAGDKLYFADSYKRACALQPNHFSLRLEWFRAVAQTRDWALAEQIIDLGERIFGIQPQLTLARLFIASESGDDHRAGALFEQTAGVDDLLRDMALIRYSLRRGDLDIAESTAMRHISGASAAVIWPYLSLIWRLNGNEYAHWLDGAPPLVSSVDLDLGATELQQLAELLRRLHSARGPYAEQSVRGGTQTDQNLFLRHEPIVRALKTRIQAAVAAYVEQLPPPFAGHPLLGAPREQLLRGRMQFSGSWSVRLQAQGYNVSHTHPMGMISSALYIALPPPAQMGAAPAGWIQFGTPPAELNLSLPGYLKMEPKVGRLVLFPSTMWHSTVPFNDGERLVVAFDVRPPRG